MIFRQVPLSIGSVFTERKYVNKYFILRSEKSVTEPSRLNAPIVLWRLNSLTLPARIGLKLSTWRLESVAGLLSTRLTSAVYCPLRWRFRTFEMGILAMWMMENVRYLSGHLFLAELSPCRKCHGIYRRCLVLGQWEIEGIKGGQWNCQRNEKGMDYFFVLKNSLMTPGNKYTAVVSLFDSWYSNDC